MQDLIAADVSQTVLDERPAANDLRHAMMVQPREVQDAFLSRYWDSRQNFRNWLMSKLIEGVHYGVVPGCEPKTKEINGVMHYGVWCKGKGESKGEYKWYPHTQWTPKPSLYAAGADLICDIMGVRDEYATDAIGWQQMGSKSGTAVIKCKLISRATGEVVGESLGAAKHDYDPNNALKMAAKCAKVGAVINAYDLRDLFTQDEPPGPPNDNPTPNPDAPKAPPRAERGKATEVSQQELNHLWAFWLDKHKPEDGNLQTAKDKFGPWVYHYAGREFKHRTLAEWSRSDYALCCRALNIPEEV